MPSSLDLFSQDGSVPSSRLMALFTGESGTGKDAQVASFAELGPLYTFDLDHRIRGIVPSRQWLGDTIFKNISYDQYSPNDGFKAIDDKLEIFLIQAKQRKLEFKTIHIASVGSLSYMFLMDSQRLQGRYGNFTAVEGSSKGRIRGDVSFATPDDWNYVQTAWRQLVFNALFPLYKLGINIIVSCWVAAKYGKDKIIELDRQGKEIDNKYAPPVVIGERIIGPSLNLSEEIPGYFDEVWRFVKEETPTGKVVYKVKFEGSVAKSVYSYTKKEIDITGKSLYKEWQAVLKGVEK